MVEIETTEDERDEVLTQLLAELGVDPALLGILKMLKNQASAVTIQELAAHAEAEGKDVGELVDHVAHLVDAEFVAMQQNDDGGVELQLTQNGIDFLEPV